MGEGRLFGNLGLLNGAVPHQANRSVIAERDGCDKRSGNRDADFAAAVAKWTSALETLIGAAWYQWFAFEPFSQELAR